VLKHRSLRFGVALYALAAVVAVSLLPAEHLHPSLFGRPVVHRHDVYVRSHQPSASFVDHGDHRDALIVQTVFAESGSRFVVAQPFIAETTVLVLPDLCVVTRTDALDERGGHDPPRRLASPRAPPA